jgi:hypothetical protein
MPENTINPQPRQNDNGEINENPQTNGEPFESDTHKIVRRHLENEDDIITEEDIANVRVGMTAPQFDAPTEARFEEADSREKTEEEILGETDETSDDKNLEGQQITPWDTVDPTK